MKNSCMKNSGNIKSNPFEKSMLKVKKLVLKDISIRVVE